MNGPKITHEDEDDKVASFSVPGSKSYVEVYFYKNTGKATISFMLSTSSGDVVPLVERNAIKGNGVTTNSVKEEAIALLEEELKKWKSS